MFFASSLPLFILSGNQKQKILPLFQETGFHVSVCINAFVLL